MMESKGIDWKAIASRVSVSACLPPQMGVLVSSPSGWNVIHRLVMNLDGSNHSTGYIVFVYYDPEIQEDRITHKDGLYPDSRRYHYPKERCEILEELRIAGGVYLADVAVPPMARGIPNTFITKPKEDHAA